MKGFKWVRLNSISGYLGLAPGPLRITGGQMSYNATFLTTRVTGAAYFDLAEKQFGYRFQVERFDLQVKIVLASAQQRWIGVC